MGLPLLPPKGTEADTLTVFRTPRGIDANHLIGNMRLHHGISVAGGIDRSLKGIVRVGHMAETARVLPLQATLAAIAIEMQRLGVDVGNQYLKDFRASWEAFQAQA